MVPVRAEAGEQLSSPIPALSQKGSSITGQDPSRLRNQCVWREAVSSRDMLCLRLEVFSCVRCLHSSLLSSSSAMCSGPLCSVCLASGSIQPQLQLCCLDLADPPALIIGHFYQGLFGFSRQASFENFTHVMGPGRRVWQSGSTCPNHHTYIPVLPSQMTDITLPSVWLV